MYFFGVYGGQNWESMLLCLNVILLLQGQLAEGQKKHQKVLAELEREKREACVAQERVKQQLSEQTSALAASQKALADATSAAATARNAHKVSINRSNRSCTARA